MLATIYNMAMHLFGAFLFLHGKINAKSAKAVAGRKLTWKTLKALNTEGKRIIWFHAASLGEFEQGRPLIEKYRKEQSEVFIVLSFFSPSGYEIHKDYRDADAVLYLPVDTKKNAVAFVRSLKPDLAVFIKYELWYNFFNELLLNGVDTFLISAQFRGDQWFFKSYGQFMLDVLKRLTGIFTADRRSEQILVSKGFHNTRRCGDTRLDRVLQIAASHDDYTYLVNGVSDKPVLIAGSTWPEDEAILQSLIDSGDYHVVVAPHEVHPERIGQLAERLGVPSIRFSEFDPNSGPPPGVIIVDTMGHLAQIYHVGDIAYVGGGFGEGIHNILEPVAHGLPVLFGPRHKAFAEARELIDLGIAREVDSSESLRAALDTILADANLRTIHAAIADYCESNRGATDCIYDNMEKKREIAQNGMG